MKITTEQYNTLKLMADDIATARAAPKNLERYVKIVVDDDGKDRVVRKFSADMTRAAILIAMVQAVENGDSPLSIIKLAAAPKVVPVEDQTQEPDEFTAAALAQIPPGKPDSGILHPPRVKVKVKAPADGRKEGDEFTDDKGRRWKIVDGKKRQQRKVKNG